MTDPAVKSDPSDSTLRKGVFASAAAQKLLRKRYAAEARFRFYGILAIGLAVAALVTLLWTVLGQAGGAFTKHYLTTEVFIDPGKVVHEDMPDRLADPEGFASAVSSNQGGFFRSLQAGLQDRFPNAAERPLRSQLNAMVARLAVQPLARKVAADPTLIGQTVPVRLPISDDVDLYLKGVLTDESRIEGRGTLRVITEPGQVRGDVRLTPAPGAFTDLLARVKTDLRDRAAVERAGAAQDEQALQRLARQASEVAAELAALRQGDADVVSALAQRLMAEESPRLLRLARLVGEIEAAGPTARPESIAALRSEIGASISEQRATVLEEAKDLARRASRTEQRANAALQRGDPRARTNAEAAALAQMAADRRAVQAELLGDRLQAVGNVSADGLMAEAATLLGRWPGGNLSILRARSAARAAGLLELPPETGSSVPADAGPVGDAPVDPPVRDTRLTALDDALAAAGTRAIAQMQAELSGIEAEMAALDARVSALRAEGLTARADKLAAVIETLTERAAGQRSAIEEAREQNGGFAALDGFELDGEAAFVLAGDLGGALELAAIEGRAAARADATNAELRALLVAKLESRQERLTSDTESVQARLDARLQFADELEARATRTTGTEVLDREMPAYLISAGSAVIRLDSVSPDVASGLILIPPRDDGEASWHVRRVAEPEANRNISDAQIAWARALQEEGKIVSAFNGELLTAADSNEPELAGALGAIMGSLFTMLVTMVLAVPIGVLAAIYLEEFAPRNRLTEIIEININNLAAVPSIVFGLLGLAVFLNFLGLPRSAPIAGGLVLALMTLPTVIIASRAALKAVPPSIREAALGVGASKTQAVFQHVLPLAMPGILTGSIIGMAQALGETAPLLLMGMVAFVAEVPDSPTDSATVLPVLVFQWATRSFRAWEPMTAGAIIILLVFMIVMNALAVILRRRFERRW